MWQHQAGRIDFDEPLLQLLKLGWGFGESAPIVGAPNRGSWSVIGISDAARVRGDRPGRLEAWAEAVRLALMAADESRSPVGPSHGDLGGAPDEPSVRAEECARLREAGWSFSEHLTAQANGLDGWVVSGARGGRRVRCVDDNRSAAWSAALILAALAGMEASGGPPGRPRPDRGG